MTYGDGTYTNHTHSIVHTGNTWADWTYLPRHAHPVNGNMFTLTDHVKEPEMSVADQIAKERQDAFDRKKLEAWWDGLEEALPGGDTAQVIRFTATYKDKAYTYAAVWTGESWYATGYGAPQRVALHPFIHWLIEREVEPEDIEVWS